MDELTIGDEKYVSSKRAAEITGYAKDYVGQLCREGRVEARLVGRNWYIREAAIKDHRFGSEKIEEEKSSKEEEEEEEEEVQKPTWESPRYTQVVEEDELPVKKEVREENEKIVDATSQLQSAWQDWFAHNARKIDESVYERQEIDQHETNKEDTYIEEVRDEVIPEEESVPIQINKQVEEESPAEEMPNEPMESDIPIHKIRPIEEEREESRSRSYLLIKIILIIMAIGCISFTLISTGALDTLFPAFSGIYTKIIWLLGSTEYSK